MQPRQSFTPPLGSPPAGAAQGNLSEKQKIMIIIAGSIIGIGLLIFMGILLFGGRDESRIILERSIAYHQEELRVNKLVNKYSDDDFDLEQFKETLNILVTSDLTALQAFLGAEEEVSEDIILAVTDADIVPRFEQAVSNNDFKDEYVSAMTEIVNKNLTELRKLEKLATTANKAKVTRSIKNHEALLEQLDEL